MHPAGQVLMPRFSSQHRLADADLQALLLGSLPVGSTRDEPWSSCLYHRGAFVCRWPPGRAVTASWAAPHDGAINWVADSMCCGARAAPRGDLP